MSKLDIHIIKNLNSVHLEVKISPGSPTVAKDVKCTFWQMVRTINVFVH